ncbi:phage tail family protein [Paenibacillus sp. IITD108]|uniref:phage tail family protein n=1 Tax=Paenibacillus sp. IITD108 TaxID=3116649 RepID=UPI002F42F3BB
MQKLEYINSRGEAILFENAKPFLLSQIDGLGAVTAELHKTRSPFQDGSSISRVQIPDRPITLQGAIIASSQEELYELRRFMSRVLNPKLGGRLIYTNDYRSYGAEAIADDGPVWGERHVYNQMFTVSLICPLPFLLDVYEQSEVITTWLGGISFRLVLPTRFAMRGPKRINVINNGDVETPIRIEFRGPASNPIVTNETTGEYIQVNRILTRNDTLVITTEFGNKRVEIVDDNGGRTNVLNWISLGSSFWQLQLGDNIVSYASDDEIESATVSLSYRNRYMGA